MFHSIRRWSSSSPPGGATKYRGESPAKHQEAPVTIEQALAIVKRLIQDATSTARKAESLVQHCRLTRPPGEYRVVVQVERRGRRPVIVPVLA